FAPAEPVEPDGHRLLRAELARELHDEVAQTLTTMVVQMENFKAIQYGRESVIRQLDSYQESTRDVLGNIRRLLFDLRGEPAEAPDLASSACGSVCFCSGGSCRCYQQRRGALF